GAAGFAWSTAACAMLQCVILLLALRHYVEQPIDAATWLSWGRTIVLTAIMFAALFPIVRSGDVMSMTVSESAVHLAIIVAVGGLVYGVAAVVLRAPEVSILMRRGR